MAGSKLTGTEIMKREITYTETEGEGSRGREGGEEKLPDVEEKRNG